MDAWPLLGRLAAPTLIVRGELSPVLPRDMAERMHAAIPKARLVEIPGAYHHLVLDDPATFVRELDAFLGPPRQAITGARRSPGYWIVMLPEVSVVAGNVVLPRMSRRPYVVAVMLNGTPVRGGVPLPMSTVLVDGRTSPAILRRRRRR